MNKIRKSHRNTIEENYRDTEYFYDADFSEKKITEAEYESSTFYGMVNMFIKQYSDQYDKDMTYRILAERSAYSEKTVKNYVSRSYSADHRDATFRFVISIAFILRLEIEKTNKLLEAADMSRLKPQKIERGDNVIIKYYDQLMQEIEKIEKTEKNWDSYKLQDLDVVKKMNDELKEVSKLCLFVKEDE